MHDLDGLLEEISSLSKPGKGFKPHKYLLLLSVLNLVRSGKISNRQVYLSDALRREFALLITKYGDDEDRDRPYTPFFHLANTSFWKLKPFPGRESDLKKASSVGGPGELGDLVQYAELSEPFLKALKDEASRSIIELSILEYISIGREARMETHSQDSDTLNRRSLQRLSFSQSSDGPFNPFVGYLNSLHRLNASNDNALAEFQACNPFFAHIHVPHPLASHILEELRNPKGRHIILTGHAGDGKSTIALEVFRQLAGISARQPLRQRMSPREDFPGAGITIIKDLSEWRKEENATLALDLLGGARRFLLVSNTGTLLDLLRPQAEVFGISEVQLESDVLAAIGEERGESELALGNARFIVVNLARMDNLGLARQVFGRMVDPERWAPCDHLACRADCPIRLNVDLINHRRDVVFERIFLAYRRMYEYGTRLTLRQITEHLAYLVTSGLEESDLIEMRQKGQSPLKAEFMFFNRFFGDNGMESHAAALQMRAIREVRKQAFGERPCPTWERKLWLKLRDQYFQLGVEDCESEFDLLRRHGSGPGKDNRPGLTPDQAREQVRRMLYFLYDFRNGERSYLTHFLNSQTILRWQEWQRPDAILTGTEKNLLEHRIYHVLQEHFTGVRLPERTRGQDRRLYVTLSRRRNEIRQSAQVVLAQIDWSNEMSLEVTRRHHAAGGDRADLELHGRGRIAGADLILTLPFLDYVVMRHYGELGEVLQAAYVERLERFKSHILSLAMEKRSDVMLVRLRTDHTFHRQQYTIREGRLEVNDVY